MRLLNHLHGQVTERITERFPEVEVVEVPARRRRRPVRSGRRAPDGPLARAQHRPVGRSRPVAPRVRHRPGRAPGRGVLGARRHLRSRRKRRSDLGVRLRGDARLREAHASGLAARAARAMDPCRSRGVVGTNSRPRGDRRHRRSTRASRPGLRLDVIALRRRSLPAPIPGVRMVESLAELLPACDHLVLAAPLTPRTYHLLDAEAFALVRPGMHLVNVARGGLVDHDALRRALDDGRVALATLDAVEPEPLPAGHWLYAHPAVRVSAHVVELAARLLAAPGALSGQSGTLPGCGAPPRRCGPDRAVLIPDSADHLFDSRLPLLIRWRRWR